MVDNKNCGLCRTKLTENSGCNEIGEDLVCDACMINRRQELIIDAIEYTLTDRVLVILQDSPMYQHFKDSVDACDAVLVNGIDLNLLSSKYTYDRDLKIYVRLQGTIKRNVKIADNGRARLGKTNK